MNAVEKDIPKKEEKPKKVSQSGSYKRQCSRHIINTKIRPPFYGAQEWKFKAETLENYHHTLDA